MWAQGTHARAVCDRCGQKFDYNDLTEQVENERSTGFRVCSSCLDEDHPQYGLGKIRIVDPQALKDARPENNADRAFCGFNPVVGEERTIRLGTVRVTVT
jgi:NAD-dependent SIR2 family protein deacetylase